MKKKQIKFKEYKKPKHKINTAENEIKNKTKNHNFAIKFIEKIMGSGF